MASKLGNITEIEPTVGAKAPTVREAIGGLPVVTAGQSDPIDPLHRAAGLTEKNLQRIRASRPGGTWRDWPLDLRSPCHQRSSGASFASVYSRMEWDEPSPTITTQAYNFGTGRFGHPEQDRAITLREAAMLQGFPKSYAFTPSNECIRLATVARLIGNAVPPPIAKAAGNHLVNHVKLAIAGGGY